MMATYYACKACNLEWSGDPWCEGCGRVSKPDWKVHRHHGAESKMPEKVSKKDLQYKIRLRSSKKRHA